MNLCLLFSMVFTRGSGFGAGGSGDGEPARLIVLDDKIRELIVVEVVAAARGAIPKMFGSMKNAMLELFDKRYVVVTKVVVVTATATVVAARVGGSFQYRSFSNTKPWSLMRSRTQL